MALTNVQQEKQWQAQDDARTLVNAETLRKDPARLKLAKKELLKQMIQKEAELKAFRTLANKKTNKGA